jgi:plastocyanin
MNGPMFIVSAVFATVAIAASPAAAAIVEVHLKEQNFNPRTVSTRPGDTIVFHSDDGVPIRSCYRK